MVARNLFCLLCTSLVSVMGALSSAPSWPAEPPQTVSVLDGDCLVQTVRQCVKQRAIVEKNTRAPWGGVGYTGNMTQAGCKDKEKGEWQFELRRSEQHTRGDKARSPCFEETDLLRVDKPERFKELKRINKRFVEEFKEEIASCLAETINNHVLYPPANSCRRQMVSYEAWLSSNHEYERSLNAEIYKLCLRLADSAKCEHPVKR